ncbi:hypothetical protein CUU66_02235 [Peribacillus deserti]|uniref:Uncharacterized protein n=1 Tax=Peribacillus deserti TaxID=673318 RepID=A0A2N5MAU2_9BACI|nr:hypothetical protein CUU66_02235 [Peribacillus deserti]
MTECGFFKAVFANFVVEQGADWNVRMLADLRGGRPSLLGFACGVSPDRKAEDGAFQEKIHPKAE